MRLRVLLLSVTVGLVLACSGAPPPREGSDAGKDVEEPDGAGLFTSWDAEEPADATATPGDGDATITTGWPDAGSSSGEDAAQHACPPCAADEECDPGTLVCVKKLRCDDAGVQQLSCATAGVRCGELTYLDRCDGQLRTLTCDPCPDGQACEAGQCRCTAEPDDELCGAQCGPVAAVDRCGVLRSVDCGACGFGQVCLPGSPRACLPLAACDGAAACPSTAPVCRDDGFCVQCAGSGGCAPGAVCDPASGWCVECLQDADCAGAGRRCLAGAGRCVQCLVGPDCDTGRCSSGHECLAAPPRNDRCAGAEPLTLGQDASGELALAADDAQASCGGDGGDLVYRFTATEAGAYVVALQPAAGTDLSPTVSVRAVCDVPATELGCAFAAAGQEARLEVRLPAGEASVWVDGAGSPGAFTLAVTKAAATAPDHDLCAGARALTFLGATGTGARWTASGSTLAATDDYAASCTFSDGPDVVYALSLADAAKVTVSVASDGSVVSYQPTVYLRGPGAPACADFTKERACSFAPAGGSAIAVAGSLAAGDYFVVVDGAYGGAGGFVLTVDVDPPLPMADGCGGYSLDVPASGQTLALDADTTGATGGAEGTCGGSGPDALYALTLAATTKLTIAVTSTGAGALRPVWHLRTGECGGGTPVEVACVAPGTDPLVAAKTFDPGLGAGTYWLFVDGFAGSYGPYRLEVSAP